MPLREPDAEMVEARKEGLRRLGWVEGQNIVVEELPLGDSSRLARELVRLKIEVIMASNNVMIAAAKAATTTIPIVMVYGDDPVRQGYVTSLARPGGNITGSIGTVVPEKLGEIRGKGIELLAECRPGLSRLAVLMDPNEPSYRPSGSVPRPPPGVEAWRFRPSRSERLASLPALSPGWSRIARRPSRSSAAASCMA